ncbi:MAG: hypothetical protein ACJA0I_000601 [Gammaproteobacteria bacterium]
MECPYRWRIEYVAHENFVAGGEGQNNNAPGKGFAEPGTKAINKVENTSHHGSAPNRNISIWEGV